MEHDLSEPPASPFRIVLQRRLGRVWDDIRSAAARSKASTRFSDSMIRA